MRGGIIKMKIRKDGENFDFKCGYCKFKFEAIVYHQETNKMGGVRGWTTPVKCPKCKNNLRTGHLFNKNKKA